MTVCELERAREVEAVVAQFKATSRHFHSRAVSKHEKSQSGSGVLGDGRTGRNIGHCGFLQYFFNNATTMPSHVFSNAYLPPPTTQNRVFTSCDYV